MANREIPKIPVMPTLSKKAIKLLTELCFKANDKKIPSTEVVFVFGTATSIPELAAALKEHLIKHCPKTIIITGGIESYPDASPHPLPEAEMIYEEVKGDISKTTQVILEKRSENTFENVTFAMELIEDRIASFCFISKSFHARRAFLTLKRFFPDIPIFQITYDPIYPNIGFPLSHKNWSSHPEAMARVWGEYLRIKTYGQRGDLPFEDIQRLVQKIDQEIVLK